MLDAKLAAHMAQIALGHVALEYPNKLDHVLSADADALPPRVLHPIFFGSFDWHSCVHGWWTLLTVRRLFPDMAEAATIARLADDSFTPAKITGELAYLKRPLSRAFERPYGIAWLLYLHLEGSRHDERWATSLEPLARVSAARLADYLAILTYPIRAGTHFNSSFALILALEWADSFDPRLAAQIRARAQHWFGGDRDAQAWEPSGDDFLSPTLVEALCLARAHPALFPIWFDQFLPRLAARDPKTLFVAATVSDRTDGKIAHLDGLNLSRAWCWASLALQLHGAEQGIAQQAADEHLAVALPHVCGDYMGEHWLQSFALLALISTDRP